MNKKALEFIAFHPPFNFLSEESIATIAKNLTSEKYKSKTTLCSQGQTLIEKFYILRKGAADVFFEDGESMILQDVLSEGDTYGGISILCNNSISIRTVKLRENTTFYTISRELFSQISRENEAFSAFFTDKFGKRMQDKTYWSVIARMMPSQEESTLQVLNQNIAEICKPDFLCCLDNTSIQGAAVLMNSKKRSAIIIKDRHDRFLGIATDKDFREKVAAAAYDINLPISDIMSAPLISIPAECLVFEAILLMVQKNIKHLAVEDHAGNIIGTISNKSLLLVQGHSPVLLIREIRDAASFEDLKTKHSRLPRVVKSLMNNGAKAENINKLVTSISDEILNKLIEASLSEVGPAPVKFIFMIMGSEGRKEQTLKTDQDNAIIFEDVPGAELKTIGDYFIKLANKICGWLDAAGYTYCNGDIMAQNPEWCQPLSGWKRHFRKWVHTPEPKAVMHSSIFFDFRGAYGEMTLVDELRRYLFALLDDRAGIFFFHLAQNALTNKPPIGFFRNFLVESKGRHRDSFDIKKAMTPIVDFARIYALENRVEATNTLERLLWLKKNNVLKENEHAEITQAYTFLMQLRFVRQIAAIMEENTTADNYINPKKLTNIEQKVLKEIFGLVNDLQTKISVHFLGAA